MHDDDERGCFALKKCIGFPTQMNYIFQRRSCTEQIVHSTFSTCMPKAKWNVLLCIVKPDDFHIAPRI